MGEIDGQRGHVGVFTDHTVGVVVAGFAVVVNDRPVGRRIEVARHHVDIAVENLQKQGFLILKLVEDHGVDIGQLIAFWIDLVVIGIALCDDASAAAAIGGGQPPGVHCWYFGGLPEAGIGPEAGLNAAGSLENLNPIAGASLRNQRVHVVGVVDMEGLQIVTWIAGWPATKDRCQVL